MTNPEFENWQILKNINVNFIRVIEDVNENGEHNRTVRGKNVSWKKNPRIKSPLEKRFVEIRLSENVSKESHVKIPVFFVAYLWVGL